MQVQICRVHVRTYRYVCTSMTRKLHSMTAISWDCGITPHETGVPTVVFAHTFKKGTQPPLREYIERQDAHTHTCIHRTGFYLGHKRQDQGVPHPPGQAECSKHATFPGLPNDHGPGPSSPVPTFGSSAACTGPDRLSMNSSERGTCKDHALALMPICVYGSV